MEEKKCRYCAMMIPKDARICPHCRKPQGWTMPAKVFMGFILFVTIAYVIGSSDSRHGGSLNIGEEGVLDSGAEIIPVAVTETAFEEFSKAKVANDKEGMIQMMVRGQILSVSRNTKVRVIDMGTFTRKVRILAGDYQGATGWVAYEYVKKDSKKSAGEKF